MRNPYLIGAGIYLRPIEEDDAALCYEWFSDPEVRRTLALRARPNTEAASRDFIRSLDPARDQIFAIVTRAGDEYIGNAGLSQIDPVNRHAELGIAIGSKPHWRHGYGTQTVALLCRHAFDTLNLNRVHLAAYALNERAIRVYERVGFRVEGRLRQHAYIEGQYYDQVTMGLLREELRDPSTAPQRPRAGASASRPTTRRR